MFRIRRTAVAATLFAVAAIAVSAAPAAAQVDVDKLSIHGFLTQGFGLSSDNDILGISADNPTTDYRAAALQVRYAVTGKDNFVVQFSHRRIGVNPLSEAFDDVQLGWAFYQRQLGDGALKLGRAPVPTGFFNETRFVGTINPLYRAPATVYSEGREAVDGAILSQRFRLGGGWSVNAAGYVGGMTTSEVIRTPVSIGQDQVRIFTTVMPFRIDRAIGGQVMIDTPLEGLRIGGDATQFEINDTVDPQGAPLSLGSGSSWDAGVEFVRSIGTLRGEYKHIQLQTSSTGAYYGQAILNANDRVSLVAQLEFLDNELGDDRRQEYRDAAAGVRFAANPGVVFKLEAHRARGRKLFDEYVAPTSPSLETTYGIASVSLSF